MDARILVVDDEETLRESLCEAIRDNGIQACGAADAETALEEASGDPFDVCICDIRLPRMGGIELLRRMGEVCPETLVILITAYGDVETAIQALREGAADYILKPFVFEAILLKVQQLIGHRELALENRYLRRVIQCQGTNGGMVGSSPEMQKVEERIAQVAGTKTPVWITGESGTGKELVARAIHEGGEPSQPFVAINCAAIPETLLESELFGHTRGAFSGAVTSKVGLLEAAGKGTVFLDEIADMPLMLQAKLLRALDSRQIQPLGAINPIPIEARIIAALNKDVEEELRRGRFRKDLFFRISVVEIEVPPLRQRREDIPALVSHFVAKYNRELGRHFHGVKKEALDQLVGYDWRGSNVRELKNVIERAMIISREDFIELRHLPQTIQTASPESLDGECNLRQAQRKFVRSHVKRVVENCRGDKKKAARLCGISLSSIYRKLDD